MCIRDSCDSVSNTNINIHNDDLFVAIQLYKILPNNINCKMIEYIILFSLLMQLTNLDSVKLDALEINKPARRFKLLPGGGIIESYSLTNVMLREFLLASAVKPRNFTMHFLLGKKIVYQYNQTCFMLSQELKVFVCNISETIVFRHISTFNRDKHNSVVVQMHTTTGNFFVLKMIQNSINIRSWNPRLWKNMNSRLYVQENL